MKFLREREEGEEEVSLRKGHRRAEQVAKRDRVLFQNEEERRVFEEVFDRQTLMTIYDLVNKDAFSYLNGVTASGKESRVYWGVRSDGSDVAVKIYVATASDFKKRAQYVVGDPRFKKFRRDSRGVAELWARKEYTNLKQCFEAGVPVPKPLSISRNVVVMEFIGINGVPAPKLSESAASKSDYLEVVKAMKTMYRKAELVHADLSEYNIMKLEGGILLFDFGSAVSVEHPLAMEFLRRDISNLNRFFQKRGVKTLQDERLLSGVTGGKE